MLVKEIMNTKPALITPTATLREAATQMRDRDIGFLPIGENDRLLGTITDRDITIRGIANGKKGLDAKVSDIMTKNVTFCFDDDSIEKAAETMSKQQLHRLIVLDKNKKLKGIISVGDIATKGHDDKLCGQVLHKICS